MTETTFTQSCAEMKKLHGFIWKHSYFSKVRELHLVFSQWELTLSILLDEKVSANQAFQVHLYHILGQVSLHCTLAHYPRGHNGLIAYTWQLVSRWRANGNSCYSPCTNYAFSPVHHHVAWVFQPHIVMSQYLHFSTWHKWQPVKCYHIGFTCVTDKAMQMRSFLKCAWDLG